MFTSTLDSSSSIQEYSSADFMPDTEGASIDNPALDPVFSPIFLAYSAVFNWENMSYLYLSQGIRDILGYEVHDITSRDLQFVIDLVHPDDIAKLKLLYQKMFDIFYGTALSERSSIRFSYNLRIKAADGYYRHILRQSVFANLTVEGKPRHEYIETSDITHYATFEKIRLLVSGPGVGKISPVVFDFAFENYKLSRREQEVLDLAAKGFTSKDISALLYLSVDTVKTHRKKILSKTGAANIAEAVRLVLGTKPALAQSGD